MKALAAVRSQVPFFVLAAALALLAWDGVGRWRYHQAVSDFASPLAEAPVVDASSPTGYEGGQRQRVLPPVGMDGYHWILQTQAAREAGEWRVRRVAYDNAPEGREVHWSSPFRWYLTGLAQLDRIVSGRPFGRAVEEAALLAGPLLLAGVLILVVPWVGKRAGGWPATWVALGFLALPPVREMFLPGNPDHHGLIALTVIATAAGLVHGVHARGERLGRRWFAWSGVAAGAGLWLSAATLAPVLVGIGLGVVAALLWWRRRGPPVAAPAPEGWRQWGLVGAAVSLAAYGLEYFPQDVGWRLEVNHPLYALALAAGGEALCRLARLLRGSPVWPREAGALALALGLVLVLPATVGLTGERTFLLRDPFLWALQNQYVIEGRSLLYHLRIWSGLPRLAAILPLLALVLPLTALLHRQVTADAKGRVIIGLVPAVLFVSLTLAQARWLGMAYALLLPLLVVSWQSLRAAASPRLRTLLLAVVGAALLPGLLHLVQSRPVAGTFAPADVQQLAERDLARTLHRRTGGGPVTVAAGPGTTTRLIYFGGFRGLGTFYWDNAEGLKKSAALFTAGDEAEARRQVQAYGITHVVRPSWGRFEHHFAALQATEPQRAAVPFLTDVAGAPHPPDWLRPLPYPLPQHPALAGEWVELYEVVEPAEPEEVMAWWIHFHLESGDLPAAASRARALSASPQTAQGWLARASLAAEQGDQTELGRALSQWLATDRNAAPGLAWEDQVRLAGLLVRARQAAAAQEVVQAALRQVTAAELRRLPPAQLADLLILSDGFRARWPSSELKHLAHRLLPPHRRAAVR